tara:strand:+ start:6725 stop:7852 length:1128 start_codon:yes stop_codon:yes gene_type:complete
MKIVFLNSHPVSYFSRLYSHLEKNLNFEVWYCSKYGVKKHYDKQFNSYRFVEDLLDGFNFKFLFNMNPFSRAREKLFDTLNPSILYELLMLKKGDLIISHGWSRLTMLLVLIFGRLYGIKVGLRGETPIIHEEQHKGFKRILRNVFLKFLFTRVDYFFFIGTHNRNFYLHHGVQKDKLIFMPYAVEPKNKVLKEKDKTNNIFFCGKLFEKKNPLDLLIAFSKMQNKNINLLFAGEGSQKDELLNKAKSLNISSRVKFLGLLNRQELDYWYDKIDLIVLPSGYGETWGLVINEAIEFNNPVIVSDMVGSSIDLCEGNGYIFECNNIEDLTKKLNKIYALSNKEFYSLRHKSSSLKEKFSFKTIEKNLLNLNLSDAI